MTKRIVIIEALSSTPAEILRVIRPFAMQHASDIYFEQAYHASLTILLNLLENEIEYQVVTEQFAGGKSTQTSGNLGLDLDGNASLIDVFDLFCIARGETLDLLRAIEAKDWQRTVRQSSNSTKTVRFLAQELVENDIQQTSRLVELVQALRRRSEYPIKS